MSIVSQQGKMTSQHVYMPSNAYTQVCQRKMRQKFIKLCTSICTYRHKKRPAISRKSLFFMVPAPRVELGTYCLQVSCSTSLAIPSLGALYISHFLCKEISGVQALIILYFYLWIPFVHLCMTFRSTLHKGYASPCFHASNTTG